MEDPDEYLRALGRAVRTERRRQGLSQTSAALRWNVTGAWLSELENGRADPGLGELVALAAGMDVEISELLSRARQLRAADADDG